MNWTEEQYADHVRRNPKNRTAVRGSVKKQDRPDALDEASKIPRLHSPCHIIVSVWKCGGNWDAGNSESKAIIDSLVKSGVLEDDTIKEIPQITHCGYRCKTRAEQKTVVSIYKA